MTALAARAEAAAEASREQHRRTRSPGPGPKGGRHGRKARAATAGGIPPPVRPPPASPPRTAAQLTAYAAARGIDLTPRPPGKPHTSPEATPEDPDTPQTHIILD